MRKSLRNQPLNSSLILINQKNYKIYGDLVITGQLIVVNSTVTINGNLKISKNKDLSNQIFICNSELFATSIDSCLVNIVAENSTINSKSYLHCPSISGDADILCDGNIIIKTICHVSKVIAKNYRVGGNNYSEDIICSESVFIEGDNFSKAIHAHTLHIGGDSDFKGSTISVDHFTSNGHVKNCYGNLKHSRIF